MKNMGRAFSMRRVLDLLFKEVIIHGEEGIVPVDTSSGAPLR